MYKFILMFYMVFVGIGYFQHEKFTTGEFWTMVIITTGVFAICESIEKIKKSIESKSDEK